METSTRLDDLLHIGGRLHGVLEQENAALRDHGPERIGPLLDEKLTLARAYESRVKGLADIPDELAQTDVDLRTRTRALGERIDALAEDNARLIHAALEANKRVLDVIAEAVATSQPHVNTYSAKGATARPEQAGRRASLSYDRSL